MEFIDLFKFRWRKLGGKDPPTLELVQKIQTLQKRLIARKEDIVDRYYSLWRNMTKSSTLNHIIANRPKEALTLTPTFDNFYRKAKLPCITPNNIDQFIALFEHDDITPIHYYS